MTDPKNDDCSLPGEIPASEVGRYSFVRDAFAEKEISTYVENECSDQNVQHVELVRKEYVLGSAYEIWDVTTDQERWWVITNLTNLYPQKYFPSADYTLSFHIGLMHRLMSRDQKDPNDDDIGFGEIERRQSAIHDLLDRAIEPEQFQNVGMQSREMLLSLIDKAMEKAVIRLSDPSLKKADFIGRTEFFLNSVLPGSSNKDLRSHLKNSSKSTWQLVNWLTHSRTADSVSASIAAHSCDTVLGHFYQIVFRKPRDPVAECPQCASKNVRSFYDRDLTELGGYFNACRECDWTDRPS